MARKRILLCEDNQFLRKSLVCLLSNSGHYVADFPTADQVLALERKQLEAFDLLISDIEMPGTSGLELSRQLRILSPNLEILLMSGQPLDPFSISELDATFFKKPFRPQEMLTAIGSHPASNALG